MELVSYNYGYRSHRLLTQRLFEVILTVHRRYYVEIKCQLDATATTDNATTH